ncbi:MAG: hypothetical protein LBC76_07910 [Treponema sp.]|jgi:hypothetical protein|nr:hypothetical protein [Treponema sp.]
MKTYLGTFKAVLRSGSVNSRVQVVLHSEPSKFYTIIMENALALKLPIEKSVVGVFSKPSELYPYSVPHHLCFERFAVE